MAAVPELVADLLGPSPQRCRGYGSCVVLAGRGQVAKIGPGALREAFVLGLDLPLATPPLVAAGEGWVVMDEIADTGRPWTESEVFVLLDDLAALHEGFIEADALLANSPVDVALGAYVERLAVYGNRERLPRRLRAALARPSPLLEVLSPAPRTLVHGDPYRGNIRRPSPDQRVWIDWEDALWSFPELDVAAWFFDGPWYFGRSFDRESALHRYLQRRSPEHRDGFGERLDAASVLMTVSQDTHSLEREMGTGALNAFITECLDALDRLGL